MANVRSERRKLHRKSIGEAPAMLLIASQDGAAPASSDGHPGSAFASVARRALRPAA
jgi:hypothetical protein